MQIINIVRMSQMISNLDIIKVVDLRINYKICKLFNSQKRII